MTTSFVMVNRSHMLANELNNRVIGFLHYDLRSLKACSLVSGYWLPAARYHLFSNITIHSHDTLNAFKHALVISPTLSKSIRDATIFDCAGFLSNALAHDTILGTALVSVRTLCIFIYVLAQPTIMEFFKGNWRSIAELELHGLTAESLRDIQETFLSLRPHLRPLTLHQLHASARTSTATPLRIPALKKLRVDSQALRFPMDFRPVGDDVNQSPQSLELLPSIITTS
jgi:hypothetical protein